MISKHKWPPIVPLVALLLMTGCGTSHQFLPGMPLESREWMVSIVWHYDMNGLADPGAFIFPSANMYLGAGKDINLGFGVTPPFMIDHLTIAKYYRESDNGWWSGFFHIKGMPSTYNNPIFEMGAKYSRDMGTYNQDLSLGIAFYRPRGWSLHDPGPRYCCPDLSLIPVLKCGIYGKNAGLSYSHYHGHAKKTLKASFSDVFLPNDTLLVIPGDSIESIELADYYWGFADALVVRHPSGDSTVFTGIPDYPDALHQDIDVFKYWSRNTLTVINVGGDDSPQSAIINVQRMLEDQRKGYDLVITRYPEGFADKIKCLPSWKVDNSFGLGINIFTNWK